MGLSTNCWKYLVLTFNVLFAMSAVVLFGASGYLLYRLFLYRHFIGVNVEYPAILLLMMAIITCSIAWIGWRTAKSMHQIHVIITGILIILVVVIEFSCFVWAMVVWDNVEIDIKSTIMHYFEQSLANTDATAVDTIRWDRLQVKFECCGVTGPSDYTSKGQVPFSCCGQGPLDSMHKPYAADCAMLYQRGCGKPLHDYAREQLLMVAMTALVASIMQLLGLAVIGIGVAFQLNWTVVKDELKTHLTVAPWVFIIIGAIMFVIAFFGCCGAIRESHCMVVTYAIFLLVIIIVQVVIAVLLFAYGDTIRDGLVRSVNSLFDKRSSADVDKATDAVINNLQQQFACCGKNGPQDYTAIALPDSCCTTTSTFGNVIGGRCTIDVANKGCSSAIAELYEKWNKPIAGVAIGIACIEVVGALFALCLANSIRNMDRRYA